MLSFEDAVLCPRCRVEARWRAEDKADGAGARLVMAYCTRPECPYYRRSWFFAIDDVNTVLYHTLYNT